MAKIIDPDQLNQGTEVVINTGAKTVQLLVAGNLNDTAPGQTSGVTGRALYSFLKEEWKSDASKNKFRFPIQMIYEASFIWINGWAPADQQTRDLLRDAGFQEQTTGRESACIISLGSMNDPGADLAYYQQVVGFNQTTSTFDKTGELNENIQIFDGGATDYRDFLKVYLREQAKLYAEYNLLVEQGLSALTYQAYRLPLSNATDLKINESDANIDANTPYTGMSVSYLRGVGFTTWADSTVYPAESVVYDTIAARWYFTPAGGTSSGTGVGDDVGVTDWESYAGERQIGTSWFAFNRIIAGNAGTAQEIYNWGQRQLRKTSDINADALGLPNQDGFGTVNGNVAVLLAGYLGDQLETNPGVYIDNFDTNDTNSITFYDITVDGGGLDGESVPVTSTGRNFPFVAAGNMEFSDNLTDEVDADTLYRMYFAYITRRTGSYTLTLSAGATGDLTWAGTDLDHIQAGDYITLTGFTTNPGNNGLYLVNSVGVNTMNITHQKGTTLVTETATVTVDENPFESPGAIVVNDNGGSPIQGLITAPSIAFDFDYDNNVQGGRTAGTDAPVIVVAQGLPLAQWTLASYTITRSTGQSIPVNAIDELNYSNPA